MELSGSGAHAFRRPERVVGETDGEEANFGFDLQAGNFDARRRRVPRPPFHRRAARPAGSRNGVTAQGDQYLRYDSVVDVPVGSLGVELAVGDLDADGIADPP